MAYAGLFERLAEPYLVLDCHLAPIAANAAWRAQFGSGATDSDDAVARSLAMHPQHEELVRSAASGLSVGRSQASSVGHLEGGSNAGDVAHPQSRYWQVFASLITATESEPAFITLRYEDVTERELTLVADEPPKDVYGSPVVQLGEVLALAGLGAWEMNVSTGGIRCSEQCLRHFGVEHFADVTREWLLGDLPDKLAATPDAPERSQPFEFERLSPDGRHWVLVCGVCRFKNDGSMQAVTGFTLDLTSRKRRELELDALANAERTARERSEVLARTMDQFVAAVSHELRSPLNAIVTWAELLQLAMDPMHVARAGEAIRRNGRQLSHMVDDLLDSGAIATGKLSVNIQPVDLGALAAIVAEDVRKLAQHKELQLHTSDISPCLVMADESRMKQVIWNLLANAVKFTDAGKIEVSVRGEQDYAEMTVRDTGRGIAADALPLVFDRFQQIAPQSSGRVGGLGLGLWLARHIVSLHAGSIAVASDGPGCGATFTVRLPLATTGS